MAARKKQRPSIAEEGAARCGRCSGDFTRAPLETDSVPDRSAKSVAPGMLNSNRRRHSILLLSAYSQLRLLVDRTKDLLPKRLLLRPAVSELVHRQCDRVVRLTTAPAISRELSTTYSYLL